MYEKAIEYDFNNNIVSDFGSADSRSSRAIQNVENMPPNKSTTGSQCSYNKFVDLPFPDGHNYTQSIRSNYQQEIFGPAGRKFGDSDHAMLGNIDSLLSTQKMTRSTLVSVWLYLIV